MPTTFPKNMTTRRIPLLTTVLLAALLMVGPGLADHATGAEKAKKPPAATKAGKAGKQANPAAAQDPYQWRSLFDGKTLKGWKSTPFGGEGKVYVKDGCIVMEMGDSMTGITWAGEPLPKVNYEIRLEAKRTQGGDFFATTTFPVEDSFCSFVVGGWGGTVVGLSSIDYYDASDNETSNFVAFKDNVWYKVRVRVTKQRIEGWIDDDKLVDFPTKGHKLSIRIEVDLSRPLGISTWLSEGWVRNIQIRQLKPEEVAEIPDK
jgi:hypothetical protein